MLQELFSKKDDFSLIFCHNNEPNMSTYKKVL